MPKGFRFRTVTRRQRDATLPFQYNLMMLALLAFEVTIYRHQKLYRLRHDQLTPPTRTLFHDVARRHLDDSVLSCIKYFLNYFFYKFGLEVSVSHSELARIDAF